MLKLTENSKTKFSKSQKNTFGLLHGLPQNGGTCIGATCGTGGCLDTRDGKKRKTCYVEKIISIYKGVGTVLTENTAALQNKTKDEMVVILRDMVQNFVKKTKDDKLLKFRLHWAGDFMSEDYVSAWVTVIKEFPKVRFWTYTRSFVKSDEFIEPLLSCKNLSLFLSCDPINFEKAKALYKKYAAYSNLGLAWLGEKPPEAQLFRWVICPETSGKVKNTKDCGACAKCRLCVDNYKSKIKNIRFLIH